MEGSDSMFSYDPSLPTYVDKIRFLIQDTNPENVYLQNEEIEALLGIYRSYKTVAVACCEILAVRFAADADDKKVGELELQYRLRSQRYMMLAKTLRAQVLKFIIPYAGGVSRADIRVNERDESTSKTAFKRGMFHNFNTGNDDVNEDR